MDWTEWNIHKKILVTIALLFYIFWKIDAESSYIWEASKNLQLVKRKKIKTRQDMAGVVVFDRGI